MMFRNESEGVARKAEKRYETLKKQMPPAASRRKQVPPSDLDFADMWAFDQDWLLPQTSTHIVSETCMEYPSPESLSRQIVPSIEDQALGFFIGNYVAQPTIVPRGQFEWVPELLSQPNPEVILRISINAASLAAFANATKSPDIMRKAQAAYGNALRMTNNALRVQETAIKDSTLISVIMLGTYENSFYQDKDSAQAWARHVDGASALLNLRGKEQFQTGLGRRIFHQFYGVILLVALEMGKPVHPGMYELYQNLNPMADYSVHGRSWTTRMVNILHDAIDVNQDRSSDPRVMVSTALGIDCELDKMKEKMPHVWDFETIQIESSEHLYGDTYHVYLDPWIAQMWNNIKICRMNLYRIIRENLIRGQTHFHPPVFSQEEYNSISANAEKIVRSTMVDIVASVPQITGMIPFADLTTARRRASDPSLVETLPIFTIQPPGTYLDPSQSTQMVHLIWPLYAVGRTDLATTQLRQWCIDMLQYLALRIGTRQAVVLAEELKEMQRIGSPAETYLDNTFPGEVQDTRSTSCSAKPASESP